MLGRMEATDKGSFFFLPYLSNSANLIFLPQYSCMYLLTVIYCVQEGLAF